MSFPEKAEVRRTKYELARQDAEVRSTILGKYELLGRQAQKYEYEVRRSRPDGQKYEVRSTKYVVLIG